MTELLDSRLVYDLRDVINKTNIFVEDPIEKEKFNLICAVMDQFDNSVMYLNNNQTIPKSENEVILYFHHCCIIRDGIKVVSDILNINSNSTTIFEKYCQLPELFVPKGDYKGDDKFFEYLRSLFFAHPFITGRSIPNPVKGEIQYSPYILNNRGGIFPDLKDSVGVMVYSNKKDMFHICIKFEDLKEYIRNKYLIINDIINSFQKIIDDKEKEWSNRKVNRTLNEEKILLDVIDILKERYLEDSEIKELYEYLTCEITNKNNEDIIEKYRKLIKNSIPKICDCIDTMDYDELYQITNPILNPHIKEIYPMMHYQLEKIYCYLNDDGYGNIYWGLKQSEAFSKEFAKEWVEINTEEMSFIEIKLLVTIACYYQAKKEV